MAKSVGFAVLVVLAVSVSGPGRAFAVRCDPAGADAAALAAVWSDVDAQCPCAAAASRGTYVKCAGTVVKTAVSGGTLSAGCKKSAKQRAALATCGRPGAVVCCRTMANGTVKGQIAGQPARCTAPAKGQACIASATNVVDGCSAAGCVACGNSVIEQGETCDPPGIGNCNANCQLETTCGNNVIDPGETCEPPGVGTCGADCQGTPTCGNGVIEPGETCEPPGVGTCDAECHATSTCGNGVVEVDETCEPPGSAGCTDSCVAGTCAAPPSGEITVACNTFEFVTASVGAGAGGYLVAWPARGTPTTSVIRVRRLDAAASPVDPQALTVTDPAEPLGVYNPLIAGDAGGWYVGYQRALYPQWSMDGLHVAPDGTAEARHTLGSGVSFGQCQSGSFGPSAVAAEGDSRFAVATTSYAGCIGSGVFYGHVVRRVAIDDGVATNTSLGATDPLIIPPYTSSGLPVALAHGGADSVEVSTRASFDMMGTLLDRAINAYWLTASGQTTRLSSSDTVASTGVGAGGSDGQFLAAWAAIPAGGGVTQVRTLRFTRADGALDPDGGVVAASGVSPQTMPEVVFDGANWLLAWRDGPSAGPWNVLGVRIAPDGTILDTPPRVLATDVARAAPHLTSRGSGWLLSLVRSAGAGLWSLNVVPIAP